MAADKEGGELFPAFSITRGDLTRPIGHRMMDKAVACQTGPLGDLGSILKCPNV